MKEAKKKIMKSHISISHKSIYKKDDNVGNTLLRDMGTHRPYGTTDESTSCQTEKAIDYCQVTFYLLMSFVHNKAY